MYMFKSSFFANIKCGWQDHGCGGREEETEEKG
jgi:hypothetical protein